MFKTITWDKAFTLVEDATAVSVESHSNELNYPFCLCDDGGEDNRIELDMNDDVHIVSVLILLPWDRYLFQYD